MTTTHNATVINGALHLDKPLELPEQSRVTIEVHRPTQADPAKSLAALRRFKALNDVNPVFSDGKLPTRDELLERR